MDREILWNIINSALAAGIFFLGSIAGAGEVTLRGFYLSLIAGLSVGLIQFKNYWDSEKPEYEGKIFNFMKV